jgi:hypothetical protein
MSGNGTSKAKMATKDAAAMAIIGPFLSARPPIRITACSTMARTAAFRPKNSASTTPTLPQMA